MSEIFRRTLRERRAILWIGLPLVGLSVVPVALGASVEAAFGAGALMMVLFSAGLVSRDVRSGALQMLLARPLYRSTYLLGRFLGVLALESVFLAGAGLCASGVGLLSHHPVSAGALLVSAAGTLLQTSLYAALLLLFSTFLPGFGDVLAYVLLWIVFGVGTQIAAAMQRESLQRLVSAAKNQVLPEPSWVAILRTGRWLDPAAGAWALALAGALALAAFIFSRRELSYAND